MWKHSLAMTLISKKKKKKKKNKNNRKITKIIKRMNKNKMINNLSNIKRKSNRINPPSLDPIQKKTINLNNNKKEKGNNLTEKQEIYI